MKKILVADDSVFFREQITHILEGADYQVVTANDGEETLDAVQREKPDMVLLDVEMPGMSGFEVCRQLRDSESNNLMPIIMLTSRDDQDDKLEGLELGADDYIVKPFNERELLSRIRNTLRRIDRNRDVNPLTHLRGNIEIQREINRRISLGAPYSVLYFDLDNFKSFNDVYGFAQGDIIIKMTADIITEEIRSFGNPDDFIGHIGGDDFVAITTPSKAEALCKGIIGQFDARVQDLFTPEHRAAGSFSTTNRRGQLETFPLTSLSIAIVSNEHREFGNHLEVSTVASELKSKLKRLPGSNCLMDQRKA